MKSKLLILLCITLANPSKSQTPNGKFVGINLMQIQTSTLNFNYTAEIKPHFTALMDIGYTFNYAKAQDFDWIEIMLTPIYKCNCGYELSRQSGGYLKVGGYFNLRRGFEKKNFFHFGMFLTNSIIYEKGTHELYDDIGMMTGLENVKHTVYIWGLNVSGGYELSISKRLKSNLDLQLSLPNKNHEDLFGYYNFIPGMGLRGDGGSKFLMLVLNLKYRL